MRRGTRLRVYACVSYVLWCDLRGRGASKGGENEMKRCWRGLGWMR